LDRLTEDRAETEKVLGMLPNFLVEVWRMENLSGSKIYLTLHGCYAKSGIEMRFPIE
jgi:hypothetical protein